MILLWDVLALTYKVEHYSEQSGTSIEESPKTSASCRDSRDPSKPIRVWTTSYLV